MAATLTSMDCVASSAQEWPASHAGLGISADLGRVSLNNALHGSNRNRTPIGTVHCGTNIRQWTALSLIADTNLLLKQTSPNIVRA